MNRQRAGNGGFTLVELLIALSLLGLTMTTVVALFSSGMRLRSVTRERMAFERDARLLVGALADDLANLVPAGPAPMVTADSIVLWRCRYSAADESAASSPLLVTYQWSGSASQDSQLVRVSEPLTVDAADFDGVRRTFRQWSRIFEPTAAPAGFLIREGSGSRFGPRAVLNERSGSWVAFPSIRSFACGITTDPDERLRGGERSRILVKLSALPWPADPPLPDPLLRLALIPDDGTAVEAGFWLPFTAQTPVPEADDAAGEVQP